MFRMIVGCVIWVCGFLSVAHGDDALEKLKKDWEDKINKVAAAERGRLQERADAKLEEAKQARDAAKKLKKPTKKSLSDPREPLLRKANAAEKEADSLLGSKKDVSLDFALSLDEMKVGDFGKIGVNRRITERPRITIFQVIDKNNVLLKWGQQIFWCETNTVGLVDGKYIDITDYVHATGTKQYKTASGTNTVLVIKVIP